MTLRARKVSGSFKKLVPGLNASEIEIPHDKHHEVSSLVKSHQNTQFFQI